MNKVVINRADETGKQTISKLTALTVSEIEGNIFSCDSLELGWKNNQHDISCIPKRKYICKWTRSNRLSLKLNRDVFTYEVMNVPDRTGIRIHSASFFSDLLGCISLGETTTDINGDHEVDLMNSRLTVERFNTLMNREDFELTIK